MPTTTTTPLTLKVYRGDELLRSEQFTRDIIKIGRLASAHLCLDDEKISRIHSVIEVAPDGAISIIDMGSAEGTYVNGKRVSKGPLRVGDQITLGGLRILLERAAEAAAFNHAVAAPASVASTIDVSAPAEAPAARDELDVSVDDPTPEPVPSEARSSPAPTPQEPSPAPVPKARTKKTNGTNGITRTVRAVPAPERPLAPKADRAETEGDEVYDLDLGVELRLLWKDTLLDAGTFVRPAHPVLVGETPRCHFLLAGSDLPVAQFPILRFEDGEYLFLFAGGMTGVLEEKGTSTPLSQLVKDRKATPDAAIDGAYSTPLPPQGAIRIEFGSGLSIEGRFKHPPKPAVVPWWERINYQFLNLFLVLLFLEGGFIVAAQNYPYGTDTVADDLFKNPSRMAKFIIKPPDQQPKTNPYLEKLQRDLQREQPGEMAEKHKGTEGQMGRKDAPKTNARSAPRAIDPNAKDLVKNSGLLAALGRGRGATGGLSTIFGQGGLGGDLKGAIGNMFGPVVGDSYGLGGLGLKGTGSGGGGAGQTIGIGGVGTKGRGGGLGSYGTGVGGLGKKSDRDVSISTGNAMVMGAIDKELVRKVIRDHASQIRYCYEQQLALNPKLEGKVAIRWIITANGTVSSPQVDSGVTTLDNSEVQRCMMSRIASWEFPKPKGGGMAVITYPWILRSSGSGGGGG